MGVAVVGFGVVGVASAAVGTVTLIRHWPPTMDRQTTREATRALRHGRLPATEPARAAAVQLAEGWARGWSTVVMLASLAGLQLLLGWTMTGLTRGFSVAVAGLCTVSALTTVVQIGRARRALRSASRA